MKSIEEYDFLKSHEPEIQFEIVDIDHIVVKNTDIAVLPHKLRFYQILIFTKGAGKHIVDFQEINYKSGTIIPIGINQVQMFRENPEVKGHAILFTKDFLFKSKSNFRFFRDFLLFNSEIQPLAIERNDYDVDMILSIVHNLKLEEERKPDFGKEHILKNILSQLLINLERAKRNLSVVSCSDSLELFSRFEDLLEDNLGNKISVAGYADKLNVSDKTLTKVVKLCTGRTPKKIIDSRNILEIKRLLSYTEMTVKEIAYQTGFDEPTNMVKYFKKHTGSPPMQFRESLFNY